MKPMGQATTQPSKHPPRASPSAGITRRALQSVNCRTCLPQPEPQPHQHKPTTKHQHLHGKRRLGYAHLANTFDSRCAPANEQHMLCESMQTDLQSMRWSKHAHATPVTASDTAGHKGLKKRRTLRKVTEHSDCQSRAATTKTQSRPRPGPNPQHPARPTKAQPRPTTQRPQTANSAAQPSRGKGRQATTTTELEP